MKFWVDKTGTAVQKFLGSTSVNQNQFDALTSFAYSMRLPFTENGTLMRMAKANPSDPKIRDQFLKYTNGGKPGLKNRREKEANLYFKK